MTPSASKPTLRSASAKTSDDALAQPNIRLPTASTRLIAWALCGCGTRKSSCERSERSASRLRQSGESLPTGVEPGGFLNSIGFLARYSSRQAGAEMAGEPGASQIDFVFMVLDPFGRWLAVTVWRHS